MSVTLTPKQVFAVNARMTATCTDVEIRRWHVPDKPHVSRAVEVSQFDRRRLIETVKIGPSGTVKVLS